jgi:tRNA (guanine37-N1)-methyltransferase
LLHFEILTLFPEVFGPFLESSLIGKAREKGLVSFQLNQIRDFATDKHRTVDDTPYGGGEGMLLRVDVLHSAWKKAVETPVPGTLTVLMSPQGEPLTQALAKELVQAPKIVLVCGHYEGVDERFVELCVDREISIGDYVLTGGELPAMVVADAVTRLVPGVVGNDRSVSEDSLEGGLLKYPQYTRPREYEGLAVPDVLLGGNHGEILKWRDAQRRSRTAKKRPDLLD